MDWGNHKVLSNFWRLGLGGFERPSHSHLQICSNFHFFVSINNWGHTLIIMIDKLETKVFTMM